MRQVGDRLGRYTLLKRLAVGGMGEVFLAAKPGPVGFGPYVAVKILRDELACDQQFVDMLVDEANISMFLNHQNVVSVLDLSEDQGAYYIAMEYVQGVTVERLVDTLVTNGEQLDIPHALYIATELCRALKYAHTRVNHKGEPLNIVHRDVTPANILLSVQGEVKLTDFGIARARGRIHQTQAGVLKGKFGYMAPEMVRYERIDARADLFCAGVVIYLMMSGRHPVAGAAVMEAIQRFEQKRIPPPSHYNAEIPPALDTIIMRALEPQPDHRWGSATALGEALRDVLLQNPEWRKHAKDGGPRLAKVIRRIAPEEFAAPMPPETLAELLEQAQRDLPSVEGAPPALTNGAPDDAWDGVLNPNPEVSNRPDPELPTDGGMPVFDERLPRASTDLETDERMDLQDVRSVRDELLRAREPSVTTTFRDVPDPDASDPDASDPDASDSDASDLDSGAQTAANPVIGAPLIVGFQDGSPERNPDLLAEPALPAEGSLSSAETSETNELTEAGFGYQEEIIGRPVRSDTGRDERTVVNEPHDEFESHAVEGVISSPPTSSERVDDGKTVAGAFVDTDDPSSSGSEPVDPSLPRILDSLPDGPALSVDDASTVIPLFGAGSETDRQTPLPVLPEDSGIHDATLLDGIDTAEVKKAVAAMRRTSSAETLEHTQSGASHPALDAVTIEAQPDEVVVSAAPLGGASDERTGASEGRSVEALLSSPILGEPLRPPAKPPVRVLLGADGEVSRIVDSDEMGSDGVPSTGTASINQEPTPVEQPPTERQAPVTAPQPPLQPPYAARGGRNEPNLATQRPMHRGAAMPDVGQNTGRWMAGELDANALSWDDEAAARRAVATRDKGPPAQYGAPAPARPTPGPVPAGYASSARPFWERNVLLLGTMFLAFALLTGLVYAILFTPAFWPRLKLSSEPPGALVLVDGVQAPGRTPLVVQVEPERRHRIEFRLEGHKRTLREITEGIGRAKTYTLTVKMERLAPRVFLPVKGRVFLNGRQVGEGRDVVLSGVSKIEGSVVLRVEAAGHEPYEVRFATHTEIPASLDVPLRKQTK